MQFWQAFIHGPSPGVSLQFSIYTQESTVGQAVCSPVTWLDGVYPGLQLIHFILVIV